MPRCLLVQHVAPESAYDIGVALADHGVEVDACRVFRGEPLPTDLREHDGLVVMGGPMSAHRDAGFPTRRAEVALLAEAIEREVPTLGVCLGAQLLALAGGGEVFGGEAGPEVGWAPVYLTHDARDDALLNDLPIAMTVLHWHSDTFRPGSESTLLASSAQYEAQAFRSGPCAWGFQFHVEVDAAAVGTFVDAFSNEAEQALGGTAALRDGTPAALAALSDDAARILSRFAALVATGAGSRPESPIGARTR